MLETNLIPTSTPNQKKGRAGLKPEAFVIHTTDGKTSGSIVWVKDPKSSVSYHYIVDEVGDQWEFVKPEDTAWHAGKVVKSKWAGLKTGVNPNLYTLGIAFGGLADRGPTFLQFLSMAELIARLAVIHSIPLDREHVIGHYEIRTDKVCPGPLFNIDAMIYLAKLKKAPS